MKSKLTSILLILLSIAMQISVNAQSENISFSGYVRNYTGALTSSPNDFTIVQNTFNLNIEKRTDKIGFKVNPFLYHYFDKELDLGLREAYVDMYFKNFDLRVGRQQIIWGKAEGVFITDVVSPKDLREFLLPDFDEIRMGITAFKLNYYLGNSSIEAVWSPVFIPTQMPENESIWAPKMIFPMSPEFDYSNSEVKPSLKNSELFVRYASMGSKIDFELVGGTFFYDDPAMNITRTIDPSTMQLSGLIVKPEYNRVNMAGGSFSKVLGGFVLRGEGAFYNGRYFQTSDPMVKGSVIEKDNLHYMAGLDYTLGGVKLSTQIVQEYIIDYEEGISNQEFENTMTFLAKKDYLREKLWLELFAYVGLNKGDALVRPKVSYAFADGFDVQAGANLFFGDNGRFGQYDKNDMVYLKLKYSF
ncbi:MAG: hypothetical protein Q7V19_00295 [Bacteroidales bacterium]|nr:hypothetical protein [Bacteroidales bacterium]